LAKRFVLHECLTTIPLILGITGAVRIQCHNNLFASLSRLRSKCFQHGELAGKLEKCHAMERCSSWAYKTVIACCSSCRWFSTARDPTRLTMMKSRDTLNMGSWRRRWQVSCAEKSLSPTLLMRSFCTAFREVLSSFRFLTMLLKISFSGWERGSHLVAYFAQYSMTLWRDTQYWMSTLARHAES